MWTRKWLRMSWWNAIFVGLTLTVAGILAVNSRWFMAIALAAAALTVAGSAIWARSGRASDLTRLNAIEFADERDRRTGTVAFAIVGVIALVLSLGVFLAGIFLLEPTSPMLLVLIAQVLLLTIGWFVANVVALRRS